MVKANVELIVKADDKASGKLKGIANTMKGMSSTFRKAGIGMLGVGAALGGSMLAMAKKTADAGDEIAKMAKRTGFAVETLSELRHVAQISGTELGSIEKATKRMSKAISDASDGMATYTRAFEKIGLNVAELQAMSPEEQFWKISSAMANLEDHTLKVAVAQDIFGRAGTQLLPMLEEGAEGIANLRAEAHELGMVFDEEAAKEAEEMKDAMQRLESSLGGVAKELVSVLLPDLTKFAEKLVEIIKGIKDWIIANPQLVSGLKLLVGVLIGGGGILLALSAISKAIIAVNAALVIFHALSGPAGWIKLAAGMALAGGVIFGMTKLLSGGGPKTDIFGVPLRPGSPLPPEPKNILGFAGGGIVTGPTMAMLGEAGPEAVIPLGGGMGSQEIHIHVDLDGRQLTEVVYENLLKQKERNNSLELS